MEIETVEGDVYQFRSVAEAILTKVKPGWRQWVLRKLIPLGMWNVAPQTDVYQFRSVAEAIFTKVKPGWRQWVLRKLIPLEMWNAAPQTLVDLLPKGKRVAIVSLQYRGEEFDTSAAVSEVGDGA